MRGVGWREKQLVKTELLFTVRKGELGIKSDRRGGHLMLCCITGTIKMILDVS